MNEDRDSFTDFQIKRLHSCCPRPRAVNEYRPGHRGIIFPGVAQRSVGRERYLFNMSAYEIVLIIS
jgi:hypothetical protein